MRILPPSAIQSAVFADTGYLVKYIPKTVDAIRMLNEQEVGHALLKTGETYVLVNCIYVTRELVANLKAMEDFADCKLIIDPDKGCYFAVHRLGLRPNDPLKEAYPA